MRIEPEFRFSARTTFYLRYQIENVIEKSLVNYYGRDLIKNSFRGELNFECFRVLRQTGPFPMGVNGGEPFNRGENRILTEEVMRQNLLEKTRTCRIRQPNQSKVKNRFGRKKSISTLRKGITKF